MPKRNIPPLEKDSIRLRLLERTDLEMTRNWRNQEHIRKWFVHADVIAPEQHKEWFEEYLRSDNDYVFIIEETRDFHRPVGQVSIYNIDWRAQTAEFGRLLIGDEQAQGIGIAKSATQVLLNYAFQEFGIRKIELEVFRDNLPAISIYRQCGFGEISERDGLKKMQLLPVKGKT